MAYRLFIIMMRFMLKSKALSIKLLKLAKKATNNRIKFKSFYGGNTLYNPEDLPFDSMQKVPDTFTGFRKAVEKHAILRKPIESLSQSLCKPHPKFEEIGSLNSLKQFGCDSNDIEID